MSLLEDWSEESDWYRYEENQVLNWNDREIASGSDGMAQFYRSGTVTLQGEIIELEQDMLIVEGTLHYWNEGTRKAKGRFSVLPYKHFAEIDGPLP